MNILFAVLAFCFSFFGLFSVLAAFLNKARPTTDYVVVSDVSFAIAAVAFVLGVSLKVALWVAQ
jgi:hypothetical protein